MNIYYSYRFNSIFQYWEVIEHIPELERIMIIRKYKKEIDAARCVYESQLKAEYVKEQVKQEIELV